MAVMYQSPGVYQETVFVKPQAPLTTGIPAFVGFAEAITPLAALPGELILSDLPQALQARLQHNPRTQQLSFKGVMTAAQQQALLAVIPAATVATPPSPAWSAYRAAILTLAQWAQPIVALRRPEEFAQHYATDQSYLQSAIAGFFENGGETCYLSRADKTTVSSTQALIAAISQLTDFEHTDVIAVPDAVPRSPVNASLDLAAIAAVQHALIQHCQDQQDCFALIDALPNSSPADVLQQRQTLLANQSADSPVNGALYYPWVVNDQGQAVPPCGHIAGVIARCDRTRGVFKAPANELLKDVQSLTAPVDAAVQNQLNPVGINCIRPLPGRGIRVFGARTLSENPTWRYISTRRLFITLRRWIDRQMIWATFEPNGPRLWIRIQRELSAHLTQLWREGALQGAAASEAFFVKCDAETNPPEQRELGQVQTEVGLAVTHPAEFLIMRITQRPNETEVT